MNAAARGSRPSHADPRYSEAAYLVSAHRWFMMQGEGGDDNELVRAQQQLLLAQQQLTSVQQQLKTVEQEVQRQGLQLRNGTDDRNRLQVMTAIQCNADAAMLLQPPNLTPLL